MKRRRLLLLVLLFLLLLGGLLLVPSVRWPVYGWLRGEAFYQGMPTSWWAREIEENYQPTHYIALVWRVEKRPSIWDQFSERFVSATAARPVGQPMIESPLLHGDPDALPMLFILVSNKSAKVRRVAIAGLACHTEDKAEIVDLLLLIAQKDPDEQVRVEAGKVLMGYQLLETLKNNGK